MTRERPFFSIIIPTYNRPDPLRRCLESFADVDYPPELFEVIVVDDGGETSPRLVVETLARRIPVKLLSQPNQGPAAARNRGAKEAKGNYLVFMDDDCAAEAGWLRKLAARFSVKPDHVLGGKTLNALSGNIYAAASQALIDYLYGYYNARPARATFFTSNNLALPRDLFLLMDGFDAHFPHSAGEDRELCHRLLRGGFGMTYAPEVNVYHSHSMGFLDFWKQHFRYGQGAFLFHKKKAALEAGKIKVEPLSFYTRMLVFPFSPERGFWKAFCILVLLLISQIANTLGFFTAWVNRRKK